MPKTITNNRGTFNISDYSGHGWAGDNYDPNMSVKEVASEYRREVRKAFKPKGFKISVRYDRHNHILVEVQDVPKGFYIWTVGKDPWGKEGEVVRTDEMKALLDLLSSKLESFNRDDTESMTDYFDTKFYKSVTIDWELKDNQKYHTPQENS